MRALERTTKTLAVLAVLGLCVTGRADAQPQPGDTAPARYSSRGADTCLQCHSTSPVVMAVFETRHAVPSDPRGPFGPGQLQCEACHGPGAAHLRPPAGGQPRVPVVGFAADSITPVAEQEAICLGCHDRDAGIAWHGGAHDDNAVGCASCHTIHAARDAVLETTTAAEVCFDCHQTVRAASLRPYTHPLRNEKMGCTACHSPHGSSAQAQLVRQTVNDTCYQCHAEKRGPFLWEHAPVAEDCSTCHAPHGSIHPAMLSQRAPFLCQSCHSQAGHPSFANDADGLPAGLPSRFLLGRGCANCHSQVHGSNHPSGSRLMR